MKQPKDYEDNCFKVGVCFAVALVIVIGVSGYILTLAFIDAMRTMP